MNISRRYQIGYSRSGTSHQRKINGTTYLFCDMLWPDHKPRHIVVFKDSGHDWQRVHVIGGK